jgi:hypothetical protein
MPVCALGERAPPEAEDARMKDRVWGDPIAGLATLAIAVGFFILSFSNSGGAELFPRIIAVLMTVCSIGLIARGFVRRSLTLPAAMDAVVARRIIIAIALTIAYVALFAPLGYLVSGLIFVPAMALALGLRNYVTIVSATVIYVVGLYFLFSAVFHTPLPEGAVFSIL